MVSRYPLEFGRRLDAKQANACTMVATAHAVVAALAPSVEQGSPSTVMPAPSQFLAQKKLYRKLPC